MKINASLYYKRFSKRILWLEKIRKIGYIKIFFYFKKLSTRDMKVNLYNIYIFYPLFFFSTKQKSFPLLYFSTFPIKQLEGELKFFLSLHFSISSHFFISQSNGPLVSSSNSKVHQFLYLSICTFSFFLFGRSSKCSIFIES